MTQPPTDAPDQHKPVKDDSLFTRVSTAMLAVVAIPMLLPAAEPWFQGNLYLRIAVVAVLVLPFVFLSTRRAIRRRGRPEDPADEVRLGKAADRLAAAVREQWFSEATNLKLNRAKDLIDLDWDAAGRRAPRSRRDRTLTQLPGLFDDLAAHGSPRLVLLGGPESGKSASLVYLTLRLLKTRGPQARRVPVLFTLADWNTPDSFEDWLIARLTDQHTWLTAEDYGPDLPALLIRGGYILPVLDSFDEISVKATETGGPTGDTSLELRKQLIASLNETALELPGLILSSRTPEYTEAERRGGPLDDATVIELQPLTKKQVRAYLERVILEEAHDEWRPVFNDLRDLPFRRGNPALLALTSPLVLRLTIEIWEKTDMRPAHLTDRRRFPDAAAVTAFVLREFAPTRFKQRPSKIERKKGRLAREEAMRSLQYLAANTRNGDTWDAIRWWELSMLARTPTRIAAGAIGFALTLAAVGLGGRIGFEQAGLDPRGAWLVGGLLGLFAACLLGYFCYRNRPPLPAETQVHTDGKQLMTALKSGIPIFLFATVAGVAMLGPERGPLIGFGFALPIGAMYALVTPDPAAKATNPRLLLTRDLRVGYVFGAAYAVPAFVVAFVTSDRIWLSVAFAIACALAGALLYGAQWALALRGGKAGAVAFVHLALAILVLAPKRHLPWKVMHFLEEAHKCGILRRQAGGTYEFRHANIAAAIAARGAKELERA
ncbi:hypothetical protein O1R50_09840 [Glycomyces luteolus]|uniref:NACHT domain-containing protein n=1 Tax=Glycomyces luteolus TaxID=2670330 RepID=A0A9X3PAU4_9ACTN|nr:hypothetical protein [Glycomyces luteolus]MDA1359925.1 hypothetical protein [Glycomyces luteolus]